MVVLLPGDCLDDRRFLDWFMVIARGENYCRRTFRHTYIAVCSTSADSWLSSSQLRSVYKDFCNQRRSIARRPPIDQGTPLGNPGKRTCCWRAADSNRNWRIDLCAERMGTKIFWSS